MDFGSNEFYLLSFYQLDAYLLTCPEGLLRSKTVFEAMISDAGPSGRTQIRSGRKSFSTSSAFSRNGNKEAGITIKDGIFKADFCNFFHESNTFLQSFHTDSVLILRCETIISKNFCAMTAIFCVIAVDQDAAGSKHVFEFFSKFGGRSPLLEAHRSAFRTSNWILRCTECDQWKNVEARPPNF